MAIQFKMQKVAFVMSSRKCGSFCSKILLYSSSKNFFLKLIKYSEYAWFVSFVAFQMQISTILAPNNILP